MPNSDIDGKLTIKDGKLTIEADIDATEIIKGCSVDEILEELKSRHVPTKELLDFVLGEDSRPFLDIQPDKITWWVDDEYFGEEPFNKIFADTAYNLDGKEQARQIAEGLRGLAERYEALASK